MSIFVDMCNKATEICREMGNDAPNEIVLKMLLEELSDDEREKFEQERLYCCSLFENGANINDAWKATEERFSDSHGPR